MSPDMRSFCTSWAKQGRPVSPRKIGIGCTVAQGKARQDARVLSYVTYDAVVRVWAITQLGLEALARVQDLPL
ncbi:hypothetical protein MOX02_50590 [Methylobacterium oxalidis]|uniref:Uncharacterized protein n=1 Tax=Methylobacterium oxalidis TaxID=944322 RepID=A0A512JAS0_9HYPH|nr:hypothetical protein MOX02_50590 [Methylobacterium oxalidis]GJE29852.1 hypothetical protein LDDCCGHA_0014 [Methylobacterium oxalidis]GLS64627.1 hypothetical protein GCM10007888_30080 [Methylobacterium oxalidis]